MKKMALLWFGLAFVPSAFAQDEETPAEATIYKDSVADVAPQFPGGIENFYKYFASRFKKPEVRGMVDKVVLSFVVEADGSLTDIRIVHDAGFGTADQAATIVRLGPKWTPGAKDGKRVRVLHVLPIAVVTEE